MKKTKLSFRDSRFNEEIERYNLLIPLLNEVLATYNETSLPALTNIEFKGLFSEQQAIIFDKMNMDKPFEVNGFKVDKEKAFELLSKPFGYEKLVSSIEAVKSQDNYAWHLANVDLVSREIVLKPHLCESAKEMCTIYATTEDHLKAFKFAEDVVNSAKLHFGDGEIDIPSLVEKFISSKGSFVTVKQPYSLKYEEIASYKDPY